MLKITRIFVAAIASLGCSSVIGASITGVDLRYTGDSNPAKAEFTRDIEATNSFRGQITANLLSGSFQDTSRIKSGWSVNASASYASDVDIPELGESQYRISIGTFRENKTGPGAPFYQFAVGLSYLDAETEIRDSTIVDLLGSVNFQPTGFFDTTLGLQVHLRDAATEVFDSTKTTLFATANFTPAPRMVLRTGLRYVIGNEISTATPTVNIVNNASVIEPDAAFGALAANRFAYLIDANSAIVEAGFGYEFTSTLNANLLYRYITTTADGDIGYDRNMLEFTISIEIR